MVLAVMGSNSSWATDSGSVEGLGFPGGGGPIVSVMVAQRERVREGGWGGRCCRILRLDAAQ